MAYKGFRWENDWHLKEMLRLDEFGLDPKYNFIVPDKYGHFAFCFLLTWVLSYWLPTWVSALITAVLMIALWEFVWDGMFRYGASVWDLVADITGIAFAWVCLWHDKVGQTGVP